MKYPPSKFALLACLLSPLALPHSAALAALPFKPDIVVAADGSGDFKTVQSALESIKKDNRQRLVVFVKDGLYHEKIRIDPSFVTLLGESQKGTRLEFPQQADGRARGDGIGIAIVNINGNDVVLQNLTVKNSDGQIGPHAMAVFGTGDKTVIEDCAILSQGADTLSLWSRNHGRYYHARLTICGSVDFVCPRGTCYMTDSTITQVNSKAEAAIWHDGSVDKDMKFVLRNCRFDGPETWILGRHHHDAQFYLLDCQFSKTMRDQPIRRVIYPLNGGTPSQDDILRNQAADPTNRWGERTYFYDCHKDGGDYGWFGDNLASAPGAPSPTQITAAWTFGNTWDPESNVQPSIKKISVEADAVVVAFSEAVTVKGTPQLVLSSGEKVAYSSGSGGSALRFATTAKATVVKLDLNGAAIVATDAGATIRSAALELPKR